MDATFFSHNRRQIAKHLGSGIVVLAGHHQLQRNNDMAFPFEQEANFWYLTGIKAPDWRVIIDLARDKTWLVAPQIASVHQIFDGSLSHESASRISGINEVISQSDEETLLGELARKHSLAYTLDDHPHRAHFNFIENPAGKRLHSQLERIFESVRDCRGQLAKLRAIKQPVEIQAMKKAISATMSVFQNVKQHLSEYQFEYELEAEFDYRFKQQGLGHAYNPIVASGKNACTLHYGENTSKLKQHQLVLMDIGARYQSYAADITRTYAIGTPTKRQVEVHEAVASAHRTIIRLLKPGLSVSEYHEKVDDIMKHALITIGLIRDNEDDAYREYFPHAISHGLGIDTHDALGKPAIFKAGMVLTVEPGIYIPKESIGIRIEDDILITEKGHSNLSSSLSTDLI